MRDKAVRDVREEQQELEALHRLDEECVHQQRAGDYLKAFDCMERALVLRRHFFGIESEEVIQACRALAEMCNLLAMSFLQQDNYAVTIDLLKKAEVLTQRHHPVERATTMNNLACYYRRLGKLHSAMTSLKRALELEKRLENVRNAADTQLNMCAVLSQLGKHQEALEHAQEALITLQEGFINGKHTTDATVANAADTRLDRISVMCIAYHNIGVEQEFLKDCAESVASYKKGIGLAEQYLGVDHSITTTIRNSYLAAKRTLAIKTRVKLRSASRNEKSPTKAGARHLSSPRSDSLRMPSPLAKDRHNKSQIPTPRSIIADALSRAPMSALPPLEVQSSSASKKKKAVVSSEVKSTTTPPLSPTDPFFSPRFRFDSGVSEPKTKKQLASITNPQTVATSNVEVQAPLSSSSTREKRKSSLRKSSLTATSGRVRKSCIDAGTNDSRGTISTEDHTESAQNAVAAETVQAEEVSTHADSSAHYRENNVVSQISALNVREMELTVPPLRANKSIKGFVLKYVDGAISTVLSHVVGKIAEQGYDHHSHEADRNLPDRSPLTRKQETSGDLDRHIPEAVNLVDINEMGESSRTLHEGEGQADFPESYDSPIPQVAVDSNWTTDELVAVSGEPSQQLTEGDVSEAHARVGQESTEDENTVNGGSLEDGFEMVDTKSVEHTADTENADTPVSEGFNNLAAVNSAALELTSDVENSRIDDVNEEPTEMNPGEATKDHALVESDGATAIISEQYASSSLDVEATDSVIPENSMQYNHDDTAPVQSMFEDHSSTLGSPDDGPTTSTVDEQAVPVQEVVQHFSNGEDEFTADLIENEVQGHNQGTESYETEEYHYPSCSSGNPITEVLLNQENASEHVYQEVNSENYIPSDQEFADPNVYPTLNYEQQNYEYVEVPFSGDTEQDWSSAEQTDPEAIGNTADYNDFYQDTSTLSHEEQFSYDENVVVSEDVSNQLPQEDESIDIPTDTVPNDSTIDVDTITQGPAVSE